MKKNKKGFTLIELLVSISIIAILTALLSANFVGARQRGRDGKRKSDMYQIQSALELYRSDNGKYPLTIAACGTCLSPTGTCLDSDTKYMQKIPCDPSGTLVPYVYSSANGSTYTLYSCLLENPSDNGADNPTNASCPNPADTSFTLTNP